MEDLYNELRSLFSGNGYQQIKSFTSALEAFSYEGFVFSQMMDGEYFESVLYMSSDDLWVGYDILAGEYECDLFIDSSENKSLADAWKQRLSEEVDRLALEKYRT